MASRIRVRRSSGPSVSTATAKVVPGEMLADTTAGTMFLAKDDGSVVKMAMDADVVKLTGTQAVAGAKTFSDITTISNSTASSSTTTGALVVSGGIGVAGAVHSGADSYFNGIRIGKVAGTNNTVIGDAAGASLASGGNESVLVGYQAGDAITTGDNHVAVGAGALSAITTNSNTVAVGYNALLRSTAADVVAVGSEALDINTLGTANVAVGRSALGAATTAIATVTTTVAGTGGTDGAKTGIQLERDSGGTMVTYPTVNLTVTGGAVSGTVTVATGGSGSTSSTAGGIIFKANAAGITAGVPADWRCQLATVSTATNNTAVGHQAGLSITTGSDNTCIGRQAGDAITTGEFNTALSAGALGVCTTGSYNVALGTALGALTTGNDNMGIGLLSLSSLQTGVNNVSVGRRSLQSLTGSASGNIGIGNQAGRYQGSGTTELTGATNSVFIGNTSRANGTSQSNQVVIAGLDGLGDGSNTTVINNSSTTSTRIAGTAASVLRVDGDTVRIVNDRTPATAGAAGNEGDFCWDANYLYICIAANTWRRVAHATW